MMTVMIKWNRSAKKLKIILSLFIAFSLIFSVGAACLRPQFVFASTFAGTLAGYILTLFASFNTAITNTQVVTAINQTFGNVALEATMDPQIIDQGIAQIAATTGFDMSTIFATTASEAQQVMEAAGITGTVATAVTAGQNLATGGAACFSSAVHAVLPVVGGVVLPLTAAVAAGVVGGILIDKIRTSFSDYIKNGFSLNTSRQVVDLIGSNSGIVTDNPDYYILSYDVPNTISVKYNNGNYYSMIIAGYTPTSGLMKVYNYNMRLQYTFGIGGSSIPWMFTNLQSTYFGNIPTDYTFGSYAEAVAFINSSTIDSVKDKVSPDIIGYIGNQRGEFDDQDGKFITPAIRPAYENGSNVITYIDPSDYNDFMEDANNNTSIGDTEEDVQGNLFDDFIRPYISPIEETPEIPDQPENPEQQPTVPYPDPEEYPDAIPEVNPVPDTDIAPTAIPYPELPEPTDTEITDTNDKITPFDLRYKFPFCLPFDIHKALTKLKGAREAPYFVWEIPFGDAGEQTVTVDLRAWDEVASILRLLELLLFIVGLAVATRNLIGGT